MPTTPWSCFEIGFGYVWRLPFRCSFGLARYSDGIGYRSPTFSGSRSIPAILGTFIFVYGGKVVIQGARYELSGHKPGMMTLISLGIVFAFAASLTSSLGCSKLTPVRRTGSSYAISDLTLLTMTQLRRLVRSTFNG